MEEVAELQDVFYNKEGRCGIFSQGRIDYGNENVFDKMQVSSAVRNWSCPVEAPFASYGGTATAGGS